jgi:predicted metal-dependent HD superfamily phosphohydrolase
MKGLGFAPHAETYARIEAAYAEPHRHYHTAAHIGACLNELDGAADCARFVFEVEAALWFHDAIYDPRSPDNERRSADWAAEFLAEAGAPAAVSARVQEHVMATRHASEPALRDSALVVDIDLSILGQASAVYGEFERNVREEYRWVPGSLYRRRRCEILQSFLDREHIYALPHFRARYETQARANLEAAIAQHSREAGNPEP